MKNIMSNIKFLSLFLVIVFCFSFCSILASCDSNNHYEYQKTSSDYIRDQIDYRVYGIMRTNNFSSYSFTSNISSSGENRYKVTGKVTLTDEYGDNWIGNYDAVVRYYEDSDSYDVSSFSMGKIYKQR